MAQSSTWAVLMAGGAGTRFWPASRRALPKQFLRVAGRRTLIQDTSARLGALVPPERQLVVTGAAHAELVRKQLRRIPPENVLCEPTGRNTAPCVAWAALEIARRDPDSVHCVLPSDHVIAPAAGFRRLLRAAAEEAGASGALVTFGVLPTHPATGYGYIETGAPCGAAPAPRSAVGAPRGAVGASRGAVGASRGPVRVLEVARFVEKPDRERAERFLASGNFLWNSGMFVWRTAAILAALREHAPAVIGPLERARGSAEVAAAYPALPSVSIDVAVLEKARGVRVVPFDVSWSDVGAWPALAEVVAADAEGNVCAGGARLALEDAHGNVVHAPRGELVALVGVRDLVVVRAVKALLVCPRERAQDVKRVVDRLAREAPEWT
jgi:mannose-1-phosphate guanylyltransferase